MRLTPILTSESQSGLARFRETRVACEFLSAELVSAVSWLCETVQTVVAEDICPRFLLSNFSPKSGFMLDICWLLANRSIFWVVRSAGF